MSGGGSDDVPAASGLTEPSRQLAQSGSQTNRQWQVLVVDDDAVARTLLRVLLEEHTELQEDAVEALYKTVEFAMHTCGSDRRPSLHDSPDKKQTDLS
jgi:hypothetical protein